MGKKSKGRRQNKRCEGQLGFRERLIQKLDWCRREVEEAETYYPLVTNFALLDGDTNETIHLANLQDYDNEDSRYYRHMVNIKVSASVSNYCYLRNVSLFPRLEWHGSTIFHSNSCLSSFSFLAFS